MNATETPVEWPCLPGEILCYDYRQGTASPAPTSLKVLQWNVERNYESKAIQDTLLALDADVFVLQEIDIGCRRSQSKDHFKTLCETLGMKGGFVCEFVEIDSPCRSPRDAGGGVHGNAILSKYDIDFNVLPHRHLAFDWDTKGGTVNEPRKGRRFTLVGTVHAPGLPSIVCYCVHLEV
ncbi:hypothetical protein BDF14DRAFT_1822086, partial [Spinellus fusiger]